MKIILIIFFKFDTEQLSSSFISILISLLSFFILQDVVPGCKSSKF